MVASPKRSRLSRLRRRGGPEFTLHWKYTKSLYKLACGRTSGKEMCRQQQRHQRPTSVTRRRNHPYRTPTALVVTSELVLAGVCRVNRMWCWLRLQNAPCHVARRSSHHRELTARLLSIELCQIQQSRTIRHSPLRRVSMICQREQLGLRRRTYRSHSYLHLNNPAVRLRG